MATVEHLVFNHYEENTYIVYDETLSAVVIDPGMGDARQYDSFESFISKHALSIEKILLTHTHVDHIAGLGRIYAAHHVPVFLHADACEILRQSEIYASVMGFDIGSIEDIPFTTVSDCEIIPFGNNQMEARLVPGHAAGSLVFCLHSEKTVFTGDALFNNSIGRTDLPTGNYSQLMQNLRAKVISLPDDYTVFPGHGPKTTIGSEKIHNPFLNPSVY